MYNKTYKQILKEATGLVWNKKQFHVHHIDHDHCNDSLSNLLLPPKKLHGAYHRYRNYLESMFPILLEKNVDWNIYSFTDKDEIVKKFIEIKTDMYKLYNCQRDIIRIRDGNRKFDSSSYYLDSVGKILTKYK